MRLTFNCRVESQEVGKINVKIIASTIKQYSKKYMKRILLSFSLIAGLIFSALAQQQDPNFKVSVGGEFLYAVGDVTKFYDFGYGASLQGEYKLSPKLSATASGGYVILAVSKLYEAIYSPWGVKFDNSTFYPVKGGLKYKFHPNFYAAGEAGAAISKNQAVRATSFAYAGGLGAAFPFSSKSSLDVGLRYEAWALSTKDVYSFVGLRAAYVFGF